MDLFWREILGALGTIVGLLIIFVVTKYVIPWLKSKLGESKFEYILEQIQAFMCAIEEKNEKEGRTLTSEEKAEWVVDRVIEIFPKLNREYIKALIDGSMRALTQDGLINYQKDRYPN